MLSRFPVPVPSDVVAHSPTPSCEHRGFVERGRKEGRRRMRQVVLGAQQALRREVRIDGLELACEELALEQLFLQPDRQGDAERREPARCETSGKSRVVTPRSKTRRSGNGCSARTFVRAGQM
jgi:hypothetical protein